MVSGDDCLVVNPVSTACEGLVCCMSCRCYNRPHSCDKWRLLENLIAGLPTLNGAEDKILLMVKIWADKTLVSKANGRSVHPVKACIVNDSLTEIYLLGYLPEPIRPSTINPDSEVWRCVKRAAYSICMKAMIQPILDACHRGVIMLDRHGKRLQVFPTVFVFTADNMESKIFHNLTPTACEMCTVSYANLSALPWDLQGEDAPVTRTETMQKAAVSAILQATSGNERSELMQEYMTHAVPCAAWGLLGSDCLHAETRLACSSTMLTGIEIMHTWYLGTFQNMLDAVEGILTEWYSSQPKYQYADGKVKTRTVKQAVDTALSVMNLRISKDVPRMQDMCLPSCAKNDYIQKPTHAQANQNRFMIPVMPHITSGYTSKLVVLFGTFAQLHNLVTGRNRTPEITDTVLKLIHRKLSEFQRLWIELVAPHMPSKGRTIKFHHQVCAGSGCIVGKQLTCVN